MTARRSAEQKIEKQEPYRGFHRDSGWTWLTADGNKVEVGSWYKSRKGYVVKVIDIDIHPRFKKDKRKYVHARSHETGNVVYLEEEQVSWFVPTEEPKIPEGTQIIPIEHLERKHATKAQVVKQKNESLYDKYPHIIPGSIYQVENVYGDTDPKWKKKREGKSLESKGATRCKIKCDCGGERDIKVQDAFQVRKCSTCKENMKKEKSKEALQKLLQKKAAK